jgi:hypothetical protein
VYQVDFSLHDYTEMHGQQNIKITFISLVFPTKILYEFLCLTYLQQPWDKSHDPTFKYAKIFIKEYILNVPVI